jgi:hypothetical protein
MLPYCLYVFGMGFDIASAVTVANLCLYQVTDHGCKGAMYVCLVFYCSTKIAVQAFLIERAHAVRHKLKKRLEDWIWISFVVITILGFGTIVILAFRAPQGKVNPSDQQCRIGLPRVATMVLMTWDILINVSMTATFIVLLQPLLRKPKGNNSSSGIHHANVLQPLEPILGADEKSGRPMVPPSSKPDFDVPAPQPLMTTFGELVVDKNTDHLKALVSKTIFGTAVMVTASTINL